MGKPFIKTVETTEGYQQTVVMPQKPQEIQEGSQVITSAGYPSLEEALVARGYSRSDIKSMISNIETSKWEGGTYRFVETTKGGVTTGGFEVVTEPTFYRPSAEDIKIYGERSGEFFHRTGGAGAYSQAIFDVVGSSAYGIAGIINEINRPKMGEMTIVQSAEGVLKGFRSGQQKYYYQQVAQAVYTPKEEYIKEKETSSLVLLSTMSIGKYVPIAGKAAHAYFSYEAIKTAYKKPTTENIVMASVITLPPFIEKAAWKGYDIYATRGMQRLPPEKTIAPEVLEYYQSGGVRGKMFPTDKPSTFKNWFMRKNIELYGLPSREALPIDVSGRPFGYSATGGGRVLKSGEIGETGIFVSGKGVSPAFLRIFDNPNIPRNLDPYKFTNKPYIYAIYGKNARVYPKAYEVRQPNPYEKGGKPIKVYKFGRKIPAGEFAIPTNKPEVQAVTFGEAFSLRRGFYIKLAGRRVPIEEVAVGGKGEFGATGLKPTKVVPSSLPYKSGYKSVSPLIIRPSSPSYKYQKSSTSSIISKSSVSSLSYSYSYSYPSKSSYPSRSSVVSSVISKPSKPSYPSYPSRPSPPSYPSYVFKPYKISKAKPYSYGGIIKTKRKKYKKKYSKREYEYAPSLTAFLPQFKSISFRPAGTFKFAGLEVRPFVKYKRRRSKRKR
jgi:hypothetical protein